MPPLVATALTLIFVAYLIAKDIERRPGISWTLFLPLLWVFIIGSRPLTAWPLAVSLGLRKAMETTDDYVDGSPFDRLVFLALIAGAVCILIKRRLGWREIASRNKFLVFYFLFIGISTAWSDYEFVSFKRWIKNFGNVLMVLVVLTEKQPLEAVKALFARGAYLLVPISLLLVKYYPDVGRYYDQWSYQPYFCGATLNKNMLGMSLQVLGLGLWWLLWDAWTRRSFRKGKSEALGYLLLLLMTVWLLLKAQSATATTCLVLGILMVACFQRTDAITIKRLPVYGAAFAVMAAGLLFAFGAHESFVGVLGRDLTFTGRTDIWKALLQEDVNPLLGKGFYSFWLGDRVDRLSSVYYYHLNEAHNGYLETYLNTGLIGLALILVALAMSVRRITQGWIVQSHYGALRVSLFVTALLYNMTETAFDRLDLVWLSLLLIAVDTPEVGALATEEEGPASQQPQFKGRQPREVASSAQAHRTWFETGWANICLVLRRRLIEIAHPAVMAP